jgi:hypothetical protein
MISIFAKLGAKIGVLLVTNVMIPFSVRVEVI